MSVACEKWARTQRTGKASAKAVLIELAWRRNWEDGKCCPSVETLADCLEMDRKTVMSATSHLQNLGLIEKQVVWEGRKKMIYYKFPQFNPDEWDERRKGSTKKGTTKNGTTNLGSTENGTYGSTENGTYGSTENGTVTIKRNHKEEPKEFVLTASEQTAKKPKRRSPSKACPWAPGSPIPEALESWAKQSYPTVNCCQEFQKFINYNLSKDGRYKDWSAAFRNWMGNALQYQQQRAAKFGGYGSRGGGYAPARPKRGGPGDFEPDYRNTNYERGAVMKEFTPEESAELARICEEEGF